MDGAESDSRMDLEPTSSKENLITARTMPETTMKKSDVSDSASKITEKTLQFFGYMFECAWNHLDRLDMFDET